MNDLYLVTGQYICPNFGHVPKSGENTVIAFQSSQEHPSGKIQIYTFLDTYRYKKFTHKVCIWVETTLKQICLSRHGL